MIMKSDRFHELIHDVSLSIKLQWSSKYKSICVIIISITGQKPIVIGGFYRVWTNDGKKTTAEQLSSIEILNQQIIKGTEKAESVIMLGDVNLCSHKWNDKNFPNKKVAESLEAELKARDMGLTFKSDIIQANGNIASSAIDHIYVSDELESKTKTMTISSFSRLLHDMALLCQWSCITLDQY